ncbi:MAG: hypothetical protein LBE38_00495, partial [Deltaproteobacteria bacterium]|nr:hypothetical protein [Deltaproteobacteria bacterium]
MTALIRFLRQSLAAFTSVEAGSDIGNLPLRATLATRSGYLSSKYGIGLSLARLDPTEATLQTFEEKIDHVSIN